MSDRTSVRCATQEMTTDQAANQVPVLIDVCTRILRGIAVNPGLVDPDAVGHGVEMQAKNADTRPAPMKQ